jgi:hypothetical protein
MIPVIKGLSSLSPTDTASTSITLSFTIRRKGNDFAPVARRFPGSFHRFRSLNNRRQDGGEVLYFDRLIAGKERKR